MSIHIEMTPAWGQETKLTRWLFCGSFELGCTAYTLFLRKVIIFSQQVFLSLKLLWTLIKTGSWTRAEHMVPRTNKGSLLLGRGMGGEILGPRFGALQLSQIVQLPMANSASSQASMRRYSIRDVHFLLNEIGKKPFILWIKQMLIF